MGIALSRNNSVLNTRLCVVSFGVVGACDYERNATWAGIKYLPFNTSCDFI